MTIEFNYYVLKEMILSKFDSYKAFAEAVNENYNKVLRLLAGKREFSSEEICKWSRVLGIEKDARMIQRCFFQ